jgi:hypothetical protein
VCPGPHPILGLLSTKHCAPASTTRSPPLLPAACSIGGVEVTGFGGKINLNNTLQSRLMLAYETRLPALRALLFD